MESKTHNPAVRSDPTQWTETLFHSYKRDVYRYVMSMLQDAYAAEDVTQEVFLRVFRFAGQYQGRSAPRTWLFAIAKNAVTDYWRSHQMEGPYCNGGLPETAAEDYRPDDFYEILSVLDKASRDTVALHIAGGLKHREIAAVTGETTAAVKKRYSRALKRLRNFLQEG